MNEAYFLELCRHACQALGLIEIDRLGRHGRLAIDGVEVVVFFDAATAPDHVRCFADLGPLTDEDAGQLRRLLSFNLFSAGPASGVCALDPVSGHGLLVVTLWVGVDTTAEQLADALRSVARQASALRESLSQQSASMGEAA